MNSTTSTATYSSLSRSSSQARPANYHSQSSRAQPQTLPAIDTSALRSYSRVHQGSPLRSTPHPQASGTAFQDRKISTSTASSSSSHANASLFSASAETLTTSTSVGSLPSSISTDNERISEDEQDTMRAYCHDGELMVHPGGKANAPGSQSPLSPTESLNSISAWMNAFFWRRQINLNLPSDVGDQLHSHVLALHDFTPIAPNATCLSFRAGQIIQVCLAPLTLLELLTDTPSR